MIENARRWRILAGGFAAGMAGVLSVTGATAAADPLYPMPPQPGPVVAQGVPAVQPGATALMPGAAAAAQSQRQLALAPAAPPLHPAQAGPALQPLQVGPAGQPGQTAQVTGQPAQSVPGAGMLPVAAAAPEPVPATSQTLVDFLKEKGVKLEPQVARDFKALNIVLPMPPGWSHVPDPNVPDAFAVIADRAGVDPLYTSNAALVVYKLVGGDFDPKEAITHGFIDSQQLTAWRTTNASLADFGGMPSARIEGTYRENNMTLNTWRRHTIATAGPDKYLVTLAVTTSASEAVAAADDTDAITNGFRINPVGAPAAAPRAAPVAAPAPPR
ncbi:hypothetical protein CQY20_12195 [Mycolicibacterium agri]|uniref:Proline-rich 28 kDa antigen n=1 Tax=Mycolicibacterium agri TaxID=36811 RepID=A0A2A7N3V6_MYCAG|nr:LpqN/LpqT family lipoprotein [Mycolicibacterium agri]PEG38725.1 hypothetical protein CQY20_12195 [Mycolicibacterium agri]GFG53428.1 proline-rich 28 kDa antigen [Mycolicibacterium agri]